MMTGDVSNFVLFSLVDSVGYKLRQAGGSKDTRHLLNQDIYLVY